MAKNNRKGNSLTLKTKDEATVSEALGVVSMAPANATPIDPNTGEQIEDLAGETISISAWIDPLIESMGFDPRSSYVEHFWLPILGPSCIFLLRRLAYTFDAYPGTQEVSLKDVSYEIGLGSPKGFGNSITKTLNRCIQFDMAKLLPSGTLSVRRSIPPLNTRQLARLPLELQNLHESLINGFTPGCDERTKRRGLRLAVSLLDSTGTEHSAVESLLRWRIDPIVASEALEITFPKVMKS